MPKRIENKSLGTAHTISETQESHSGKSLAKKGKVKTLKSENRLGASLDVEKLPKNATSRPFPQETFLANLKPKR